MSHRYLGLALAFLLASTTVAEAQQLDPPTVTVVQVSRTSAILEIQAGPSGAPGGVWVDWVSRADFDAVGWSGLYVACSFAGSPNLNTWGATSFVLAPNAVMQIEVGDILDEQGLLATDYSELEPGTEYVIRAFTIQGGGSSASNYTSDLFFSTASAIPTDCTFTQGYWKNHAANWPTMSLTLGTVTYTQAQLLDILNKPAQGNGLIFLAHQLIAAKLNLENSAIPDVASQQAIDDADALIGGLVVPPVGGDSLAPSSASSLTQAIDEFNNGLAGSGHCGSTPVEVTTWGEVKTQHR